MNWFYGLLNELFAMTLVRSIYDFTKRNTPYMQLIQKRGRIEKTPEQIQILKTFSS